VENEGLASLLNVGLPGYPAAAVGWWNLTGTTQPGLMFGEVLVAWFDWLHLVDTPIPLTGDVIGFFPSHPAWHTMIDDGTFVPALPGDVPWV